MTTYKKSEIESEAAIYAEGTKFNGDDLVLAWNTLRQDDERLQDFFERFLLENGEKTFSVYHGTDEMGDQLVSPRIVASCIPWEAAHKEWRKYGQKGWIKCDQNDATFHGPGYPWMNSKGNPVDSPVEA